MISISGGCSKCGRMVNVSYNPKIHKLGEDLICDGCYYKYYSVINIRDKKIDSILKKSIWQKIKNILW